MKKLFLIFILTISIYADDNQTIDDKFQELENKVNIMKIYNQSLLTSIFLFFSIEINSKQ